MSLFRSSEYQNWKNNNRMSINISTESATPIADLHRGQCIACKKFVNSRQEALMCDGCNKWYYSYKTT